MDLITYFKMQFCDQCYRTNFPKRNPGSLFTCSNQQIGPGKYVTPPWSRSRMHSMLFHYSEKFDKPEERPGVKGHVKHARGCLYVKLGPSFPRTSRRRKETARGGRGSGYNVPVSLMEDALLIPCPVHHLLRAPKKDSIPCSQHASVLTTSFYGSPAILSRPFYSAGISYLPADSHRRPYAGNT